jgi:hypothetical protein
MAQLELRRLGVPVDAADPAEQLVGMVREAAGNVVVLRSLVGDLGETLTQWGQDGQREHAVAELYRVWCDRLVSYSAAAIKAGLAERTVRLQEATAEMMARAVMALLDDPELGLSREQREQGRRLAGRHLRAITVATSEVGA